MKKTIVIILAVAVTISLFVFYFVTDQVKINRIDDCKAIFKYAESDVCEQLDVEDSTQIAKLFHGKMLFDDYPACGFSRSVAVQFSGGTQIFQIARDGCGLIYLENADKYFKLSTQETEILHHILEKYGFSFPCI